MSGSQRSLEGVMCFQGGHFPGEAEAEAAGVSVDVALTPSCLETPVNLCST